MKTLKKQQTQKSKGKVEALRPVSDVTGTKADKNAGKIKDQHSHECVPVEAGTIAREEIALRALSIWQSGGCVAGQDEHNWLEAERQLNRELNKES